MRESNVDAFVLHMRPYRETSALIDLFTREHGRISAVGRGVRGRRRQSTLKPFVRLVVAFGGRGPLHTLHGFESTKVSWLTGHALYAGMYANELLERLMQPGDAHPPLFDGYAAVVDALAGGAPLDDLLRRFEKLLLKETGYELVLDLDAALGTPVDPGKRYVFESDAGVREAEAGEAGGAVFAGATLLEIARDDYSSVDARRAAKRIIRMALAPHLGTRPLTSRTLFRGTT